MTPVLEELLRLIVAEEVERNLRWSAGFFGGEGIGSVRKGAVVPPMGLGGNGQDIEHGKEEQEQVGARHRRKRRRTRVSRRD